MNKRMILVMASSISISTVLACWRLTNRQKESANQAASMPQSSSPAVAPSARREYVLEIIGLGVTYEKYRQGRLWNAIGKGGSQTLLRETDPKKFPWSKKDKAGQIGNRANDAMENGARALPHYWGMPTFSTGWSRLQGTDRSGGALGDPTGSGMGATLFVGADGETGANNDRVLERAFDFFDKYPDVPFVIVSAYDSAYHRDNEENDAEKWNLQDGYYVPIMPDSFALFVLARRERVDRIRPFVFDDVEDTADSSLKCDTPQPVWCRPNATSLLARHVG